MFWSKKSKSKKSSKRKPDVTATKKESSAQIRAQALENVRAARANIGEDTLDKIAAAMTKKQNSAMGQAKAQIQNADADRVADEILSLIGKQDKR